MTTAEPTWRPGRRYPLRGIRRRMADQMVLSKRTIPHFGYVDECDVTRLVQMRQELKRPFAGRGIKLTYLPFFIKAVARALRACPLINSVLDESAGEIVVQADCHVGIATDTPRGLMVPVLRHADQRSLSQLAVEVERLSRGAREGSLSLAELQGAAFTISSIGGIGGLFSTPIIPPSQAGILGIGRMVRRPVFDERGELQAATMVYLSLSLDHRYVEGAEAAVFCNRIMEGLRAPAALLADQL